MVGSPALPPQQGTSSSHGNAAATPQLKAKKSIDWLPKSFKRSKSTSSSSTAPSSSSRNSFRSSRQDLAVGSNAQTRSTGSSNSERDAPLGTIPGSPRETQSFSSSNDEKSGGEHSNSPSQPSPRFPVTPDDLQFQTLRVSPLPSPLGIHEFTEAQKDYLSAPPTEKPSPVPPHSASDKNSSRPPRTLDDKHSTEYEKVVLSLSSRKALRTMLDE